MIVAEFATFHKPEGDVCRELVQGSVNIVNLIVVLDFEHGIFKVKSAGLVVSFRDQKITGPHVDGDHGHKDEQEEQDEQDKQDNVPALCPMCRPSSNKILVVHSVCFVKANPLISLLLLSGRPDLTNPSIIDVSFEEDHLENFYFS